jgi:hypothetical protein
MRTETSSTFWNSTSRNRRSTDLERPIRLTRRQLLDRRPQRTRLPATTLAGRLPISWPLWSSTWQCRKPSSSRPATGSDAKSARRVRSPGADRDARWRLSSRSTGSKRLTPSNAAPRKPSGTRTDRSVICKRVGSEHLWRVPITFAGRGVQTCTREQLEEGATMLRALLPADRAGCRVGTGEDR